MAATSFTLRIVTVAQELFSGEATELHAKGTTGQLTVLAHHEPLMTRIERCALKVVTPDGTTKEFPIISGVLEVADNAAVLLCSQDESAT